jgi:hypothetical protein
MNESFMTSGALKGSFMTSPNADALPSPRVPTASDLQLSRTLTP